MPKGRDNHEQQVQYYEYSQAADPIAAGYTPIVPYGEFPSDYHRTGNKTQIIPYDNAAALETEYPATSPSLLSSYIRILPNESITTNPNSTSEVYYCIRGRGKTSVDGKELSWKKGDFMTIPAGLEAKHDAAEDTAFYWVHDEPLLNYLGAKPAKKRFEVSLYPAEECRAKLDQVAQDPNAKERSRISVLLGNSSFPQTRTITHTMWTMYGILPPNSVQLPHRHNSVALDFIISAPPGCYSLVGDRLDENGKIKNPKRVEWKSESVFITPPNKWHSHHNESDTEAFLVPMQDAGLQTHLRTLNIEFYTLPHEVYIEAPTIDQ